jgi:hypothetical protein
MRDESGVMKASQRDTWVETRILRVFAGKYFSRVKSIEEIFRTYKNNVLVAGESVKVALRQNILVE